MDRTNLTNPETVLENLRNNIVDKKRTEVWVRHEMRIEAEILMEELIKEGIITSYEYKENCSCRGSANYLIEYPI